jgi:hypothetical protein
MANINNDELIDKNNEPIDVNKESNGSAGTTSNINETGGSDTSEQNPKADDTGLMQPKSDEPKGKGEGEPELKDQEESVGRGPKPVGPDQQTWDSPEASDEVKKKINDQFAKSDKLLENPNEQDPTLVELNKKHDIESRNADPEQHKKSEINTQNDSDPGNTRTDAPEH